VGALLGLGALLLGTAACLPSPQVHQLNDLLDRLATARTDFADPHLLQPACDAVGDVQNRLYGEPGLTSVQPAWSTLRDAAAALQAVCGQATLLRQATAPSAASEQARQRWQAGVQRELSVACDHLRAAAQALGRTARPC
jgi:hypothetical protein